MIFYRNHYTQDGGQSAGYEWFTSKHLAQVSARQWRKEHPEEDLPVPRQIIIVPTRKRLKAALNQFACHPDNG
jgi:hypothetical protein